MRVDDGVAVGVGDAAVHAASRPRMLLPALCVDPGAIVGVMIPSAAALVNVGVSLAEAIGETGGLREGESKPFTGSGEPDFILKPNPGLNDIDRRCSAFRDGVGDGRPVPLVAPS